MNLPNFDGFGEHDLCEIVLHNEELQEMYEDEELQEMYEDETTVDHRPRVSQRYNTCRCWSTLKTSNILWKMTLLKRGSVS